MEGGDKMGYFRPIALNKRVLKSVAYRSLYPAVLEQFKHVLHSCPVYIICLSRLTTFDIHRKASQRFSLPCYFPKPQSIKS